MNFLHARRPVIHRAAIAFATLAVGASLISPAMTPAQAAAEDQVVVNLLDINDFHELDQGVSDLSGRVQDAADYDYLAANIYDEGTQTPVLDGYKTYDVAGVSVAVIGAITQEAPSLVSPAGIANVDFGDPVDAVNRVADELKAATTPPDNFAPWLYSPRANDLHVVYSGSATFATSDGKVQKLW